jgi:hypothetical protein
MKAGAAELTRLERRAHAHRLALSESSGALRAAVRRRLTGVDALVVAFAGGLAWGSLAPSSGGRRRGAPASRSVLTWVLSRFLLPVLAAWLAPPRSASEGGAVADETSGDG